jgi:Protein of unknown function (DUF3800)
VSALLRLLEVAERPAGDDCDHENLSQLLHGPALGPAEIVALFEAYFDESGTHDGSPVMCVAGYLFDKEGCLELDAEWKRVLDEYSLPYFRMSACAPGNHPFKHMDLQQRIDCQTKLIKIINKYVRFGCCVAFSETLWKEFVGTELGSTSAYTWACHCCCLFIGQWIRKANFQGQIAYFFEAGHESHREADYVMRGILKMEEFRYHAHAFVPKTVRPMQTADILAWQCATHIKRLLKGIDKPRADFRALTTANKKSRIFIGTKALFERYRRDIQVLMAHTEAVNRSPAASRP